MRYTEEQTIRLMKWVFRNEDGLPNEARSCYTATDWKNIELMLKHDEVPTDSSHVYQCEECYQKLEGFLIVDELKANLP